MLFANEAEKREAQRRADKAYNDEYARVYTITGSISEAASAALRAFDADKMAKKTETHSVYVAILKINRADRSVTVDDYSGAVDMQERYVVELASVVVRANTLADICANISAHVQLVQDV